MPVDLTHGLQLALMTFGYWLVDVGVRRGVIEGALGLGAPARGGAALASWLVVVGGIALFARWDDVPADDLTRVLGCGTAMFLAWKVGTKDVDVVFGEARWGARAVLIGGAVASLWNPAALLAVLAVLIRPFDQWRHHAILPMRVLVAVVAFVLLAAVNRLVPGEWLFVGGPMLVFFVLLIHISHYLSAGLAKAGLGPRWWSWIVDNRLHHLMASAYAWGWARFVPWPIWRRAVHALRRLEVPLQAGVFAVEVAAPLALLHPISALAFCAVWSAFHLGVLASAGIWFYDWIVANTLLAIAIVLLPSSALDVAFGWHAVLVGTVFLAVFPLRYRIWGPIPLAWWDGPFTQRTHWIVEGESGRQYALYGDFMCPNERLYAKVHGCFLAPVEVCSFHNGVTWSHAHRDAIRAAGPDLARLDAVRAEWGVRPRHDEWAESHLNYLRRFLHAINGGARKAVLPRGLRWLKSPGGHLHYWGDEPAFTGQERAVGCTLRFREHYFDGDALLRLRDDVVAHVSIDDAAASVPCRPEPSAREMEHFLMGALSSVGRAADGGSPPAASPSETRGPRAHEGAGAVDRVRPKGDNERPRSRGDR